ncbi:hypothetical protein OIO90_003177 [Microbotryomycetes sp. JL221]|nr:hypothetical protein OIO90_003177 [Microbotryomycetes sp. JL221]
MSSIAHAEAHQNDGDQKQHQAPQAERYEEGKEESHQSLDSKDERSLANKLAAESKKEKEEKQADRKANDPLDQPLPTAEARKHGNEPSRGAKIDEQLMLEEQEELKRKGKA